MKKILIVVDMQNDFIHMALGTKEAREILPKVQEKIREAVSLGEEIIFTRDTHGADYMDTQEGRKLPVVHCVEDDLKSEPAVTQCAQVQCVEKAPETQAPTEAPVRNTVPQESTVQTEPVEQVPAVTVPAVMEKESEGMPVWVIILIVVVAAAVLIGGTVVVTLIVVKNKRGKYTER